MNVLKLKSVLALRGECFTDIAKLLGIARQTIYNKLSENSGAEFTQGEIALIKDHLNLSMEEVEQIFFS